MKNFTPDVKGEVGFGSMVLLAVVGEMCIHCEAGKFGTCQGAPVIVGTAARGNATFFLIEMDGPMHVGFSVIVKEGAVLPFPFPAELAGFYFEDDEWKWAIGRMDDALYTIFTGTQE